MHEWVASSVVCPLDEKSRSKSGKHTLHDNTFNILEPPICTDDR